MYTFYVRLQIRDLEAELEGETRRFREALANARRFERMFKELNASAEDDRRQLTEYIGLCDQLNGKLKLMRRQAEDSVSFDFHYLV